jgi:hypothetical protein
MSDMDLTLECPIEHANELKRKAEEEENNPTIYEVDGDWLTEAEYQDYLFEGIKRGKPDAKDNITIEEKGTDNPKSITIGIVSLNSKEEDIRNALVNKVTPLEGSIITGVKTHAIDAMLLRDISTNDIIEILQTQTPVQSKMKETSKAYIDPVKKIDVVVNINSVITGVVRRGKY